MLQSMVSQRVGHDWVTYTLFFGRTDAEAEAPIFWPPDVKCQFIGKDPDAGKDWGQEELGATEDEMAEWHHRFNGGRYLELYLCSDNNYPTKLYWTPVLSKHQNTDTKINEVQSLPWKSSQSNGEDRHANWKHDRVREAAEMTVLWEHWGHSLCEKVRAVTHTLLPAMLQLLLECAWRFPQILKTGLLYDNLHSWVCIQKSTTIIWNGSRTPMFTAALFTVGKIWKQPGCPSTDEWVKKMQCVHTHTHTQNTTWS